METAGTFDLDAELTTWTSGDSGVIKRQSTKSVDIYDSTVPVAA